MPKDKKVFTEQKTITVNLKYPIFGKI